ncbi:hypothetical protein ACTXT7_003006 [Hymenolepis weldensis]
MHFATKSVKYMCLILTCVLIQGKNVKDVVPNFIWSLKKAHIDFRYLRPDQIVNHHVRTPFTTKELNENNGARATMGPREREKSISNALQTHSKHLRLSEECMAWLDGQKS